MLHIAIYSRKIADATTHEKAGTTHEKKREMKKD